MHTDIDPADETVIYYAQALTVSDKANSFQDENNKWL